MMNCTKLTSTDIQRLMLSGTWEQWLEDISLKGLKNHIDKYRDERIRYESLQHRICSGEQSWYDQTKKKLADIKIRYKANTEKKGPPPSGTNPYDLEADFVEHRGSLLFDMFQLRRRIDKVEQDIFDWITKQHNLLVQVKQNSKSGQDNPDVREELENHSRTAYDMTTERDTKKEEVMCILLEIAKDEIEFHDLWQELMGRETTTVTWKDFATKRTGVSDA